MFQFECSHASLLSLSPEKEAKRAPRNRNPCYASRRTCRRKRLTHATSPASRFLNARIAPLAQHRRFRVSYLTICWITSKSLGAREGKDSIEGFQFRCVNTTMEHFNNLLAPKLMACAAGIEYARYDFERFLWLLSFSERK